MAQRISNDGSTGDVVIRSGPPAPSGSGSGGGGGFGGIASAPQGHSVVPAKKPERPGGGSSKNTFKSRNKSEYRRRPTRYKPRNRLACSPDSNSSRGWRSVMTPFGSNSTVALRAGPNNSRHPLSVKLQRRDDRLIATPASVGSFTSYPKKKCNRRADRR